jgi:hypothetical protein
MLTSHRRTCLAAVTACLLNFVATAANVHAQHAALPAVPPGTAAAAQTAQQAAQQAAVAAATQHHNGLLKAFDANGNGLFDPREIQAAVSNLANLQNSGGAAAGTGGVNPAAFKIFDSNGDGQISPQEVVSAQMMMGVISSAYSSQVRRGFNPFLTQAPEPEVPAVDPRTEARKSRSKANRMARAANQRAKKARADAAKGKAKPARAKPPAKRDA